LGPVVGERRPLAHLVYDVVTRYMPAHAAALCPHGCSRDELPQLPRDDLLMPGEPERLLHLLAGSARGTTAGVARAGAR
jgi:hypothetical protein